MPSKPTIFPSILCFIVNLFIKAKKTVNWLRASSVPTLCSVFFSDLERTASHSLAYVTSHWKNSFLKYVSFKEFELFNRTSGQISLSHLKFTTQLKSFKTTFTYFKLHHHLILQVAKESQPF